MSVIEQVDAAMQFPLKLRVNLEKELGLFGMTAYDRSFIPHSDDQRCNQDPYRYLQARDFFDRQPNLELEIKTHTTAAMLDRLQGVH